MDLLFGVKASVPGILSDLYYVTQNEQSAIQVAARISVIDTAKCNIEEYEIPRLLLARVNKNTEYFYLYREDLILNPEQRTVYTELDCQSFQLDHFYIDGIHGITSTTTNRLHFSYDEFLKDSDMVPDFGQGVGELYQDLLDEYKEKTGLEIDSFHVVDELWGSYDRENQNETIDHNNHQQTDNNNENNADEVEQEDIIESDEEEQDDYSENEQGGIDQEDEIVPENWDDDIIT
jgi:hypothetical protein